MSPDTIFVLWLCLFAVEQAWLWLLAGLNLVHVRRHALEIPPAFAGVVDPATRARSVAYTLERGRFAILASLVAAAITVAVVTTGLLGTLEAACARLPLGPYLRGAIFLFAVSLGSWLAGLPFSLYATFSIEARFGFNRTTPKTFVLDTLKSLAVSIAIGLPVLLGLFWFMDRAGRWWWVWAFLAITAFELVMNLLYPLVIAPLFNRFTPLAEGTLRDRILELARRLGFRTKGIFVMDASRRSRHGNAYFTGLGPVKRVVLFDTLVETMSEEEILAVLAHEIGHERRHHVRKGLALSIALGLAGAAVHHDRQPRGLAVERERHHSHQRSLRARSVSPPAARCQLGSGPTNQRFVVIWGQASESPAVRSTPAGSRQAGAARRSRSACARRTPRPRHARRPG